MKREGTARVSSSKRVQTAAQEKRGEKGTPCSDKLLVRSIPGAGWTKDDADGRQGEKDPGENLGKKNKQATRDGLKRVGKG